jgi:Xaa-Pro aminopeptidase
LPEISAGAPAILFDFDRTSGFQYPSVRAAVEAACGAGGGAAAALPRPQALRPLMHRLRWRKRPAELALMRASALAAGSAIRRCIGISRPGVYEGELAATFGGLRRWAREGRPGPLAHSRQGGKLNRPAMVPGRR